VDAATNTSKAVVWAERAWKAGAVTIVNVGGPAIKVAGRIELGSDATASAPAQLWFDVEGQSGERLPYQCATQTERMKVAAAEFVTLRPGEGLSRVVSLTRCFDLNAGQTYKVTPHFKQARPSSPLAKDVFDGELSGSPVGVTAPVPSAR